VFAVLQERKQAAKLFRSEAGKLLESQTAAESRQVLEAESQPMSEENKRLAQVYH